MLAEADFSGAVLVSKGGAVVFEAGKGMADRAAGRPNTPATQFRIGSVTSSPRWFSAYNLRLPADGIDVIVLSNDSAGPLQQVALRLAKVMLSATDSSTKSP